MHCPLQMPLWPARAVLTGTLHSQGFGGKRSYSTETNFVHYIFWNRFTNHFKAERGTKQAQSGIPITLQVSGSETTNTTSNSNHTKEVWGHKLFHLYLGQHSNVTSQTTEAAVCSTFSSVQCAHLIEGAQEVL